MELEAALSEAEGALEQEENKVLRAQLELAQVRQEIERRIAEKEEEFASTKKNMGKALENMQAAVETEAKGKAEALRMKKKLEGDVLDLDCSLEHANAANAETQRNIKVYQLGLREAQAKLEGESAGKEHAHDALIDADRKCNSNQNALEEARTLLEQADRSRYFAIRNVNLFQICFFPTGGWSSRIWLIPTRPSVTRPAQTSPSRVQR